MNRRQSEIPAAVVRPSLHAASRIAAPVRSLGFPARPEARPASRFRAFRRRTSGVAAAVLVFAGCGQDERPSEATAVEERSAETVAAPTDPCGLIPVADWVTATGYADIHSDRSNGNTCDFLSDDLWGVVGSVVLPGRAMMEQPPAIAGEPEPLAGLGDEAFWLRMGPIVRVGDQVVWVTVNPAIENQRDVAIRLARTAIGNL